MMAISSLADQYKTPFIALTATHPDVTLDRAYVNQIVFDDRFQGTVAALFVRDDLLIDRVAVIHDPDNVSSTFLASEFIKKYIAVNGKVVGALAWPDQKESIQLMLDKIMEKHPELLYVPMSVAKVLNIAKILQQYGQRPLMMGADGLLAEVLLLNTDQIEIMEGLMATDFFSQSMSLTSFGHMINEKYSFGNNKILMSYAPLGAEGYALLVQALNQCLNLAGQHECINNKLRDSQGIEGIMDKVVINVDGKANRALIINKIENSEPRFMVKVR
jgi:ABC-type branched-subunit amino acid transport system substrate-binding protein